LKLFSGPRKAISAIAVKGEHEERVMAKHNSVTVGFDDSAEKIVSVVDPVPSGAKTKLSRVMELLSRYVCGRHRRHEEKIYTPCRSRDDESRLEYQRFLHW
jgi:hypothetical protein